MLSFHISETSIHFRKKKGGEGGGMKDLRINKLDKDPRLIKEYKLKILN